MRKTRTRPRKGLNRVRAGCLTAVAACAVSAVAVSSAQAVPVPISANVNYGWATIGPHAGANPVSDLEVLNGSQNATLSGTLETTTGAITAGSFNFPAQVYPGSAVGVPGPSSTLTVDLTENPASSLTGQTGAPNSGILSITGNYLLKVTIAGSSVGALNGECDYAVGDSANVLNPAVLSTETTSTVSSFPGHRFVTDPITSPGSMAGNIATGTGVVVAGGGGAQCGALNPALQSKTGDLWFGRNSLPSNGVRYSQSMDFSQLNVGAATGLSIIGSTPAVYRGIVTGTAPAMNTSPTPTTAALSINPAAVWNGATNQGLDLTPNPGSFAGHTVSVDLAVKTGTTLTGSFDASNGQETLGETGTDLYTTTVVVDGALTCTSDPDPLDLSTDKTTVTDPFGPRNGVRYAGLGGNGAMMDSWPSLPAFTPSPACDQLSGLTVGLPGGLWLSHGINPNAGGPPGPDVITTVPPPPAGGGTTTKKKCKKSKKKGKSASASKSKCKKKKK